VLLIKTPRGCIAPLVFGFSVKAAQQQDTGRCEMPYARFVAAVHARPLMLAGLWMVSFMVQRKARV